jgi:hypothetical protein
VRPRFGVRDVRQRCGKLRPITAAICTRRRGSAGSQPIQASRLERGVRARSCTGSDRAALALALPRRRRSAAPPGRAGCARRPSRSGRVGRVDLAHGASRAAVPLVVLERSQRDLNRAVREVIIPRARSFQPSDCGSIREVAMSRIQGAVGKLGHLRRARAWMGRPSVSSTATRPAPARRSRRSMRRTHAAASPRALAERGQAVISMPT